MAKSVQEWIDEAEAWQKPLLLELSKLILATVPDADEAIKWGQPCYTRNGLFCYLKRAKSHVTLGFQQGAGMKDPEGLLQGEGKQMRHMKFQAGAQIDRVQCAELIREAIRLD